jgi:hypothetical protein
MIDMSRVAIGSETTLSRETYKELIVRDLERVLEDPWLKLNVTTHPFSLL